MRINSIKGTSPMRRAGALHAVELMLLLPIVLATCVRKASIISVLSGGSGLGAAASRAG